MCRAGRPGRSCSSCENSAPSLKAGQPQAACDVQHAGYQDDQCFEGTVASCERFENVLVAGSPQRWPRTAALKSAHYGFSCGRQRPSGKPYKSPRLWQRYHGGRNDYRPDFFLQLFLEPGNQTVMILWQHFSRNNVCIFFARTMTNTGV